jgi:Cys-tRNA(Pro)/Cys-tRNA(Cys) deacylase
VTPAIDVLTEAGIDYKLHSYSHDSAANQSFGLEAATKLKVCPERVFKTLIAETDGYMCVGIVPVSAQLNLKRLAKAFGKKRLAMADSRRVERVTGYVVGGISPLGQKRELPAFMDISSELFKTIFVSAGRRGLDIEIRTFDLQDLVKAELCRLI